MSNVIELPFVNPVNAALYRELGREGYEFLMDMWASCIESEEEFDRCCEYYANLYNFDMDDFLEYYSEFQGIVKGIMDRFNVTH